MSISNALPISRLPLAGLVLLWTAVHATGLHHFFHADLLASVIDGVVGSLVTVGAAILISTLIGYLPRTGIFQMTFVVVLFFAGLSQWLAQQALSQLVTDPDYLLFLSQSMPVRYAVGFLALMAVGVVSIFYVRWRELAETKILETETQTIARDAELHKLQLQFQPHFLFNSLNSINALILIKPDQARQMVQQLSDFLRLTISRADESFITLAQELAYLETYLSIEKVRFGHRLEVNVQVNDDLKTRMIPTLVLQPLLENAIKFGLYGTTGKITIALLVKPQGTDMQIKITNPYDADMQPATGTGFGLKGLQRRLYLLYARNDLLSTVREDNLFSVNLIIPTDDKSDPYRR